MKRLARHAGGARGKAGFSKCMKNRHKHFILCFDAQKRRTCIFVQSAKKWRFLMQNERIKGNPRNPERADNGKIPLKRFHCFARIMINKVNAGVDNSGIDRLFDTGCRMFTASASAKQMPALVVKRLNADRKAIDAAAL